MNKFSEFEEEKDKQIDYLGLAFRYISFWKWFIVSVFICFIIAFVYLKFTLPGYEVTTTVLLKDDQKGGGTSEMAAFKEMGLFTQKNNVDNELEQLKTATLVGEVVNELGLNVSYTQIAKIGIIQNIGSIVGLNKLGLYDKKIIYGSECPLLINMPYKFAQNLEEPIQFTVLVHPYGEYEFSGVFNKKEYIVKASISDSFVNLPFGKIYLSRGEFKPKDDMIIDVLLLNPVSTAGYIASQLSMELTSKTTSVVNISFSTPNIQLGKDFLNKLIEVYNRQDMDDQNKMNTKAAQFIEDRLNTLARELDQVETQVETYKQTQGITDIKSQGDIFVQQTSDNSQRRLEIETQLAVVSDIDNYMHRKENRFQLLPSSTGLKSSSLNELINNYNTLVLQRNKLARIASESNQAMIDLTNQIESMYSTVQSSVRNEKSNLEIAQRDLLSQSNQNSAKIRAIPRQEREYTEIKRQQGVKEALFLFLLQKKEEKYLNMSSVEPIAKIIDNPFSAGVPISPRKTMIMFFALMMGLFIPVLIITIRDLLKYQVENKEELEKMTIVPVLGEIPKTAINEKVVVKENSTDSFTEVVRLLRTNLLFVMDNPNKKVINVVSSISGEGKSFVTINLAMSLALLDKKVIVIGLDTRKPKLADYMNLDNNTGITLFLTGQLSKEQLIQPSGIHPNLSAIMAGPIPPNPNELLAKPALDQLIKELRADYDYILIDTAPVGVVSDSFSLNRLADVNLYVVRADYTHKKNIEDATKLYKNKKLKNLYFVLNAIDIKKNTYHYGYNKKNGYGYGYEMNKE
ncbi:MAG: polysaccharide biosynthesis tyrosine autokinase [Paludibacter sp.]|nr:polysaccharide biosynthesis tyrosine autokinase [Paludibacter sp.]